MNLLRHFKLHYWPGLTFGLFIFTFVVSYLVAVLSGHVYGFFPYISDTGTLRPESCIFGQLMNFGAVSMGITLYIRYRQIDFGITSGELLLSQKWNSATLWFAIIISLGVSIVANFQETEVPVVHLLGAFMAFGIGAIYFLIQTRISLASVREQKYISPSFGIGKNMLYLRAFLSFCLFPLVFANSVCGIISRFEFTGDKITWWTEEHGGFQNRLASTFTEWILVIFMLLYVLTFTNEFKLIEYEEITFINRNNNVNCEQQEMVVQQIAKT